MKKFLALLLACLLCLSLCACKSDAVKGVEALIDAIGTVTLDSESAIRAAEAAYAALPAEEKEDVDGLDTLEAARSTYQELLVEYENEQKIQAVQATIDAIGTVSLNSGTAILDARDAYNQLPAELQGRVENYAQLEAAEAAWLEAKANAVAEVIDAIGTVTLDSGANIQSARNAYAQAEPDVQAAVSNLSVLEAAEARYTELRAANAQSIIDAIGTVTLESGPAIEAAKAALADLTSEEAALVDDSAVAAAEEALAVLQKEKAEAMLQGMRLSEDKVRGMRFYYPSAFPYYTEYWGADVRCFCLPYLGTSSTNVWLRLVFDYTADDWVFFEEITVVADGERFYYTFDYFDVTRDNDWGDVWEYVDVSVGDKEIEMLTAIANSSETIIRFEGDDYYSDFTVSQGDKAAIAQMLEVYSLLQNS